MTTTNSQDQAATTRHNVTFSVEVLDVDALFDAAVKSLIADGLEWDQACDVLTFRMTIDVGACLQQLLDPGTSPAGCRMLDSSHETCDESDEA